MIGERWALLIARELVHGPKRFSDLRAGLPRVAADVLAQRLRDLEQAGVLRRRTLPAPAGSRVYELTDWGAELAPVLLSLGRWGSRAPLPESAPALGVDAAIVALETTFDPAVATAAGVDEAYGLRLGDQEFRLRVTGGRLAVKRGPAGAAAATLVTDTATLAGVVWHGRPLDEAVAAGALELAGDPAAAQRFLSLFTAPIPA